jgi:hypothetical protein
MRYRDASHVDVGSFYSRSPAAGKVYRILGHGGVAAVAVAAWRHDERLIVGLLLALILLWLAAWYQVVGTLWRSSIVAGIIGCAVFLAAERCHACCAASAAPLDAHAGAATAPRLGAAR